jgi:hypothetical protein
MRHLKFFIKYYKDYYDGERAYVPDWVFDEKRQQRLGHNYENAEIFHNDSDKNFDHICLMSKAGKKYYKKMTMMSRKEKRQFVADYLSGE